MKTLLLLAVIMACELLPAHGDIFELANIITYISGKDAATGYGIYGCYCGLGGRGTPKDATDRCCAAHDCCYDQQEKLGCGTKLLRYKYTKSGGDIVCDANQDDCQRELCECDKTLAHCITNNLDTYDKKYEYYPNLLCSGEGPTC